MTIKVHEPVLEALIQKQMATGRFARIEDALLEALQLSSNNEPEAGATMPKKSLARMLMDSPLHGSGIVLERSKDEPRAVELG